MFASRHLCPKSNSPLRALLTLLLLIAWTVCSSVTVDSRVNSSSSCPDGWALWSAGKTMREEDPHDSASTMWCVQTQNVRVAPIEANEVCANIFGTNPQQQPQPPHDGWNGFAEGLIPQAISVHSHEQNLWLEKLLEPFFGVFGEVVTLGGAAGFGDIVWWDGSSRMDGASPYTHFDPSEDWETRSGCIAMQPNGFWRLVDCMNPQRPFLCAFTLHSLTEGNNIGSSNDGVSSSSGGGGEPVTTAEPSLGGPSEGSQQPTHPPGPHPLQYCLDGWLPFEDKCYRLYAELNEDNEEGMNQQLARSFCGSIHPRIVLTAVGSAGEAAFLGLLVQNWVQDRLDDLSHIEVHVGGIFTLRGSVGVWYEDALLYGEKDYAASSPSSPRWPTDINRLYSNWGAGEPKMPFGCVAITSKGTWTSVDCRLSLPFVCAYLNDGSVIPDAPNIDHEDSSGPSEASDSNDFDTTTATRTTIAAPQAQPEAEPQEMHCMDDWVYFQPTNRCFRVFTDRSVSAADLEQHCGRFLFGSVPVGIIHAATITSVEESAFAGQLVAESGFKRALVGVSYTERGAAGLYLDGATSWAPDLARSLWAVDQPARDRGCVVVDAAGAWYHSPCGAGVSAYACAYRAEEVHPLTRPAVPTDGRTTPPTTTTTPTTATTTTEAPSNNESWPLERRITALSGAVHLVVAAETLGTYTVTGAGGPTDGLLVMFAPDLSEVLLSVGWDDLVVASPCGRGYKKQEYIFPVKDGVVKVTHSNETMRGRVCVSDDGVHYVPAGNLTFEVVDVALHGFIPRLSPQEEEGKIGKGKVENVDSSSKESILVAKDVGICMWSSGALQLVLRRRDPYTGAKIRWLRLSSSSDCTSGHYAFARERFPVIEKERGHFFITYELANVLPTRGANLDRLQDPAENEERTAAEFYVCVAAFTQRLPLYVMMNTSEKEEWNQDSFNGILHPTTDNNNNNNNNNGNNNNNNNDNVVHQGKNKGNMSSYSCSVGGQSMWVYTLVPHLRVYLTPPHVVVRGMWALPPSALRTNGPGEPLVLGPSAKTLLISQFSSPVIVFDGEGLREGMTLLLSQKEGECHRYQPTSRRSTNNFTIPAALDTLVAVSTVASSLRGLGEGGSNDAGRRRVMFAQLNLNHTGMWGMDLIEESQTWHLCFAYTPISKFIPLVGVKITVNRARVSAITTYEEYGEDMSGSNSIASPHLQISVGFSGMLRLWGLDVHMWSVATINTAEIAFERVPPGNSRIADQTFQCSDTSFFYQQRSLGIVNPHNIDPTTTMASSSQQQHPRAAMVVIPPWFLNDETTRRMQVCLSVPLPFHSDHRVFTPTMATVDVRTIELYFIGPYAAHFPTTKTDTRLTLVEVAENVNDLVLPLFGYGLRDDMLLFLSEESCYSVSDEGEIAPVDASDAYVDRISRMNFTIMRPYDVPRKYRQKKSTHDAAIVSDLLITLNETHTSTSVADLVFGKARSPLFLCLYAPGTRRMVYPLGFRFVVGRPYVKSIRMAGSLPLSGQDGETVVVAYASFVDLLVEGFGLHEGETAFVPAVDCSNASSFLWHSPVRTAGVPSIIMEKKNVGGGTRYCSIHPPLSSSFSPASAPSRYVNPMTSMSSWFLSLTQAHTARIGAIEPVDNTITRFQWCVRYRDVDAADPTGATEWRRGFVPTGIPYQLIIPYTDGFLFGDTTTKNITRKTRHPTLGMWERIQLIGPLINHTFTLGNPLFIFLAEHFAPCKKLRKYPINTSSSDRFITAVNGTTIILPKLLSSTGSFKLCASAIYPDQQSSDEGTEAALQFFELKDLRIELVDPVYAIFSLNRTDYVTVEQGREWTLPISGSGLSTLALVRFRPVGANCSTPMPQGLEDVIVRNVFEGLTLFGEKVAISTDPQNELNGIGGHHYIVIGCSLLQGLSIQEYMLCFKPDRSTPWMSSSILLNVIEHVRRPTYYSYFNADGSNDVVSVAASPPTKIALEWLTHEKDTTHIVGAVGREVSLALWCRGEAGNNNTSALLVPCGNQRRIMLVRPLDSDADGGDPCFVDFESDPLETVRGPYVINDGILTIPREVSRSMSFYPNRTQPWIMCLETASERWRKPIYPVLKLQFATTAAVGFRHSPDNASNTTALFFGMTNSADYGASTGDRTGAEGNKTLVVHVEDTSKVFYLNGYGIQRGFMMRFGLHCDADDGGDNIASVDVDGSHGRAARVAELQGLNNILLYDEPLTLEDDHGVFLLPSTHFTRLEERAPMCLSTDGGRSYMRTNLSLQVLPSQLRRDVPADEARISELAFRHTLVVPRMSKGTVNLSELSSDNVEGSLFTIGVQVLLSSVCYMNRENLPIITVSVPNTITLIEAHTQLATKNRLHICVRMPGDVGASYGEDQNGGAGGNLAFRSSGLFFYVLNLTVTSASLHANIPNIVAEQNGIRQLVVRRGNESMMLFVTIKPGKYENSTIDVPHDTANACSMEEQYINLLNTPGVLALFRLAKFRLGKPCSVPDPHEPEATAASLSALTATFVNNTIHIATPEGSDAVSFAVPLHTSRNKAVEPWLPSSLCFSVDGGRHYLSVGISYVSVSWAPTLRVQFSMLTEEPDGEEDGRAGEVGNNESILSTVVHMFEQASFFGRLVDTRYHTTTSSSLQDPLLSRYLNEFTTDVLWSGFLKNEGFVSGGKLYLPAITINNNNNNNNKNDVNGELFFLANYRQENIPTGLVVQVEPISFHCIGDTPTAFQQVHHQSAGWLMPIANSCGRSVQSGTIIRFVDERVDSCSAPEVDYAYAMDAFIMKPRKWMGGGGTSASTALQIPTSIGYVSDGRYKLCLRKSLPHHFGREAVFMDTSVVVEVSSSLDVDELSGVRQGALAVFQGSETELTLRGSVVPFVNNILIALLPVKADVEDPTTVCETLSILLENHSINMKLSTLWKRVTDVFTLRLRPADLLPTLSPAVYSLCYSINEGISFHLAGKDAAQPLQLIALPPTVLGPATTTTQGMYNPSRVTATAVHLVRFFDNDSSSSSPLDPSSLVQTSFFADRPPSYYYSACLCFEGNGIGALSGRNVSGAVRALAVAVLRTDLFGEVCNGVNLASEFGADISEHYNPLAVPVFIIDARSGCLWDHVATTRNTDGTNYNYNRSNNNDNNDRNEDYNDDAILRSEWLMNTASLRKAGGLSAEVLLGKVSTQRERLQRLSASYLICTSVDGKHFYSANIPLRTDNSTPAWESARLSSLVTASPRESLAPLKDVSRIPLVLRVDPTVSGSYFARDLAVSLHIVVRPCLPAVRSSLELESSAGSLVRFQAAAAQLLRIDPAIIVVRLSRPRAAPPAHITYTLSLSLLTDAHVADDNYNDGGGGDYVAKGTLTPSPELLLRYATLLRSSDVQASLLSTLLPPALREAETVTVRAPYINFTFGTGVDLHAALQQNSHELPNEPPEEKIWRDKFAAIPHATLIAEVVPDGGKSHSSRKVTWLAPLFLLLFPICIVLASVYVYKRFLVFRPMERRHGGRQEEEEIRHHETLT